MSVTCGLPLNGAMASAINVLDDIHGGAGEQCTELYADIARRMDAGEALEPAVEARLEEFIAIRGKIIAGFGHRFHPIVHGRFGSGSSRCKDYIAQWPDAARRMTLYATFVEHVRFGFQDHGHAVVKLRAQLAPRPESSPMRSRSPTKA
jgi:citrate synthase